MAGSDTTPHGQRAGGRAGHQDHMHPAHVLANQVSHCQKDGDQVPDHTEPSRYYVTMRDSRCSLIVSETDVDNDYSVLSSKNE